MGRKPIKERRRREILEALYRCLLKKPYSETSIKDIGTESGINYAMLHYYFKSKEDILLNFIDYLFEKYDGLFAEHMLRLDKSGPTFEETVRSVFAFFNEHITTDKKLQKVFFEIWGVALYNPVVNAKLRKIYRALIGAVESAITKNGGSPQAAHLALATVAFHEGIGIFSVFFNFNKKYTTMLLEGFQNKIMEML
ncbi:MAG TPA: TetR/AcrR family transcriptional regulator [Spirochaetota bacterium]|nr:TetR/AcrR family transcriptional regulator [Spirochaetota bacterium]